MGAVQKAAAVTGGGSELDQQSLRSESRAFSTVEPWART
jgi:hypothetical protein